MLTTDAQRITLGNHIRASEVPAVVTALAEMNLGDLRDIYNEATATVWVFEEQIEVDAAIESIDWSTDYAQFKDDVQAMLLLFHNGSYKVEGPGSRAGLAAVLAGCTNSRNGLLALATRNATLAESLYISTTTGPGGGDGSTQGSSAIATVKGQLTTGDVDLALELTA